MIGANKAKLEKLKKVYIFWVIFNPFLSTWL